MWLERLRRKPKELSPSAIDIQRSYQILMWQLGEQGRYEGTDEGEKRRLAGLVHRRVLSLRETVLLSHFIPTDTLIRSLGTHSLVFNDPQAALKSVPDSYIAGIFGTLIIDEEVGQIINPLSWCLDRELVIGVANGLLSKLPRDVRRTIQQTNPPESAR